MFDEDAGIETSNCRVFRKQINERAIQKPSTRELRVSPASKFQSEAKAVVASILQVILTLSLILLSSSEFKMRSTPG